MATVTATANLVSTSKTSAALETLQPEQDNDHGLARFFYAAAAALILSAIQGVVQRLPGISDWLQDADYGGHMVTNLAHTHITIVGAGTISLTALIYYVLPRVTGRPLFSKSLTNVSFRAYITRLFGLHPAVPTLRL